MSLMSVISDINFNREMWEKNKMPIDPSNITVGDSIAIFRHIDHELSPEWLTCDGELSHREVEQKRHKLLSAARTLVKRGFRIAKQDTMDLYFEIYPERFTV